MNNYRKEYFNNDCYFLIEGDGNDFVLTYSTYTTITESEKKDKKIKIKKENIKNVEEKIKKITKSNKKVTKKEIDELVDYDGTFKTSKIPILNKRIYSPQPKTPEQIIAATSSPGYSITRGFRVYYGESEEKDDNVVSEIDLSDAFGYEETKYKDFKDTVKTFKKMGIEDPIERVDRAEQLGKIRNQKVKKTRKGNKVLKQRLTEKEITEEKRQRMIKMVEDILAKKKNNDDIIKKDSSDEGLSKILMKNLESIKNLAKKEGININKLINILKQGE